MNIIEAIINWVVAPFAGLEPNSNVPASAMISFVLRASSVYFSPIIIVRGLGRYTARFEHTDLGDGIWVWPFMVPYLVGGKTVSLLVKLFDRFVARMSRKIIAQDEEGIIYTETRPHTQRTRRKDRRAVFVQVIDHTGTHHIRLDPDLLDDSKLTPHDAIASTFDIEPDEYKPAMQT